MFGKLTLLLVVAMVLVAVVARTSSGHGPERTYVVRPHDTLWSIATRFYGGDPREGVWRIERRNRIEDALLTPGQRLVIP